MHFTRNLIGWMGLWGTWLLAAPSAAAELPRPNVVLILADDHAYRDFGFIGNPLVHTPHLDQLAAQSARYPRAYVPMSVCRPSLATLLTGLYPHQHGIHFNHPPPGLAAMRQMTAEAYRQTRSQSDYLIERVPTLPRILATAGYACLQTGKHWEGSYRTAGFTHGMTLGLPTARLGQVTGTRAQDNGQWVAHGNGDAGLVIGRETMLPIEEFIDQHAGQQPFFVWYAPFLPHAPFDAPPRFRQLVDDRQVPAELVPYYAEIARFDETVGQLMQMLTDRGLERQTLVLFISDNGFRPMADNPERHNHRSKLSEYEDGLRTPLLIRWPEVVVPGEHAQLVQSVDIVPTILSAVGLSAQCTDAMQGIDLMPSAQGRQRLPERPAFGAIYGNDAEVLEQPARHARGRWIRHGDYKLVVPGAAADPVPLQLYDLRRDPDEQYNLAGESQHQARQTEMTALLDQWWPATP